MHEYCKMFPHLYEKMNEYVGYYLESVDYRYYVPLREHTLQLTLTDGQQKVKLRQVRSPFYAGGFSRVEVIS